MEKTFEELCEDFFVYEQMSEAQRIFVNSMMQQVREATKRECQEVALLNYHNGFHAIFDEIADSPTDRIKIQEND